ncbi:hypothetical protein [Streptomyces acidicola]|uniref:Uncharacterized protein n=1 Tax=Streptomyces acidicola TaxID=2596892 RepID=A0A5N8X0E3_9ACTN|nr:hypothetical protein [Streptomyces acidicola]MPY53091.1 hypothetical protein [Streptomyces acidicola]
MTMLVLLSCVVLLALAGCVCVVWAARGGPRWVRAVATATLAAGEMVRRSGRTGRKQGSDSDG